MKVCLINPILFSFQRLESRSLKSNIGMSFYPPLGLCYIANVLEKNGIDVKIIDRNYLMAKSRSNLQKADKITEEIIKEFRPDIIGISATTPTFFDLKSNIARIIRDTGKRAKVVAGGAHISALPEDSLRECGEIDIACRKEGELTMLEIAQGKKLESIPGITYRQGSSIVNNPDRPPCQDIDKFCFPSRHLVDMKYYASANPHVMHGLYLRSTTIFTSRGCPYDCTFCAGSVTLGRGVRFQSVGLVIEEIRKLAVDYNIEGLYFADDVFDVNKERALKICSELIKHGLHRRIRWNAQLRANSVDIDLLRLMKRAGCVRVDIGFESGSQRSLNIINKRTTVEQNYRAAMLLHEAGIQIHANMIVGLPGEDLDDLNQTREFMKKIRPHWFGFGEFIPLPGSRLFDELLRDSRIEKDKVESLEGLNFTKVEDKVFKEFVRGIRDKIVNPARAKSYILINSRKPAAFVYIFKVILESLADTCGSIFKKR